MSENKISDIENPAHSFTIIRAIKPRNIIDWLFLLYFSKVSTLIF